MTCSRRDNRTRTHYQFRLHDLDDFVRSRTRAGETPSSTAKWMVRQYAAYVLDQLEGEALRQADTTRFWQAQQTPEEGTPDA